MQVQHSEDDLAHHTSQQASRARCAYPSGLLPLDQETPIVLGFTSKSKVGKKVLTVFNVLLCRQRVSAKEFDDEEDDANETPSVSQSIIQLEKVNTLSCSCGTCQPLSWTQPGQSGPLVRWPWT